MLGKEVIRQNETMHANKNARNQGRNLQQCAEVTKKKAGNYIGRMLATSKGRKLANKML